MKWLQWLVVAASFTLQLLVISALIRGAYKRYPFVLAYFVGLFLTTIADTASIFDVGRLLNSQAISYYRNDAIRQFLLFSVVLSLTHRASEKSHRRILIRILIPGAVLISAASIYIHREPNFILWMTNVTRDLSFSSAVLNLLLWSILIMSRDRDPQILTMAGALGVQFTGAAIGQSLRQLSSVATVLSGNLVLLFSHILCLYIWWQAVRSRQGEQTPKKMPPKMDRGDRRIEYDKTLARKSEDEQCA